MEGSSAARESSLPPALPTTRILSPNSRPHRPELPTPARMRLVYRSMKYPQQSNKSSSAIPRPRLDSTREPWRPRPFMGLTFSTTLPAIPTASSDAGSTGSADSSSQGRLLTEQDPRLVSTPRHNLFWAGRYSSIRDQLRTQRLNHKPPRTQYGSAKSHCKKNRKKIRH